MFLKKHILPPIIFLLLNANVDQLKVNTFEDPLNPPAGVVTLRSALDHADNEGVITFDQNLDGGVIELSEVGQKNTILPGEVMGMRQEPSGQVSYLVGYFDRDYGRSALYAQKNVTIDASALPNGITIKWMGGEADPARVLAVNGNLTLKNVRITGGYSIAKDISSTNPNQPWTLARGGGIAVWGKAVLTESEVYDNHCQGDFDQSRDRGAFGGGLYANIVELKNSVISGNTVIGAGAAGGGIYSVGGAISYLQTSKIVQSTISGNSIKGLFTYGGGVYSDGGGIGNRKLLEITNSTIARNMVGPVPGLPPFLLGMGYWRGGGIYMSNGYLMLQSSTVVENEVYGYQRTDDLSKSNLAGGIAATIGNAHAVEEMKISQSIIAGNTITELAPDGSPSATYPHDLFTGSLLQFKSWGYNRIGKIDFSQLLVPVGELDWKSLARKHYPKQGDMDGVILGDVVDLVSGVTTSNHIISTGVGNSEPTVLRYNPKGNARDQIPVPYSIQYYYLEYGFTGAGTDTFLEIMLSRIESNHSLTDFALNFTTAFETFLQTVDTDTETAGAQPYTDPDGTPILTLADTEWFGPSVTWPSNVANYPYIEFWHRLDTALENENIPVMGPELIGDATWTTLFNAGQLAENSAISMVVSPEPLELLHPGMDQQEHPRPAAGLADIGAIEF